MCVRTSICLRGSMPTAVEPATRAPPEAPASYVMNEHTDIYIHIRLISSYSLMWVGR